jgi:prephenate dehydratase
MKVAYLGPEKTFTEKAAKELFPEGDLVPIQPIRNVVMAVENGKVTRGVVPLENFYNGPVIQTFDSLTRCNNARIIQERALKVVHYLGALEGHAKISRIYSKDQALEQCDSFIAANFPDATTIATASTAEAADYITREKLMDAAAIAPQAALLKSGLEIIATDLCPNNSTRFIVLGIEGNISTGDDKTILAIHPTIRDRPGVLADCLNIFGSQHINLEGLHSRPDGKKGYYFYVELNGHESDENIKNALQAIEYSLDSNHKHPDTVKVLGSYANSHWKDEN